MPWSRWCARRLPPGPAGPVVVAAEDQKYDSFAAADVALAASGTVALELAMAGTPTIVTYRVSGLTAWLVRRMMRVRYANLVNILLDREVVPGTAPGSLRSGNSRSGRSRTAGQRRGGAPTNQGSGRGLGSPGAPGGAAEQTSRPCDTGRDRNIGGKDAGRRFHAW